MQKDPPPRRITAVLPAAGLGSRIAPLPGSKELFPIGFREVGGNGELRSKVVCHFLLEALGVAGVKQAFVVLRAGKWDLPAYLGDGSDFGLDLAYLMMDAPYGAPFTTDQAYPFLGDSLVAFGFCDIIFFPKDAFQQALDCQRVSGADVVLGLFPADRPDHCDLVDCDLTDCDTAGTVTRVSVKPHLDRQRGSPTKRTDVERTWGLAVWTPAFTEFLHRRVLELSAAAEQDAVRRAALEAGEVHMGDVLQAAIDSGLDVRGVQVSPEPFVDIGTPESLLHAVQRFSSAEETR